MGYFEVHPTITVPEHTLDFAQRDPAGLPDEVRRAAKPVSIYSARRILGGNLAMQQHLEQRCHMILINMRNA